MIYLDSAHTIFESAISNIINLGKQAVLFLILFSLAFYPDAHAQNPDSLAAMEVISSFLLDDTPEDYIELDGNAAFMESTFDGPRLWISDGTEYGSIKITNEAWEQISLHDGRLSSEIAHANGLLYFLAEVNGNWNIWATDGTQEGTFEVVNSQNAGYSTFYNMASFGNRVAFTAYSTNNTPRLYLVNENNSGAELVQSVEEVESSEKMAELDSSLYVATSSGEDRILHRIDQSGTVTEAWQMPDDGNNFTKSIEYLTVAENRLYFVGNDGTGEALWVFNGASATRLFNPHEDAEEFQDAINPIAVGNNVYFFSHPWDSANHDFSNYAYLYHSDGTESGTSQLWSSSLDENGYAGIDAANLPMAAAGNQLLFVAPDDPDDGSLWWTVGTSSESFQPVIVNGNTIGHSFSDPDPISTNNGAWFTNSSDLFFTSGTNEGAFMVPPEEVHSFDDLAAINGLPWFSARTSYSDDLGVWRVRKNVEIPDTLSLIAPEDNQDGVSVLPTFKWTSAEHAEQYRIQITSSYNFTEIDIDTVGIDSTTFSLSDSLEHVYYYYWRVQGINDGITGEWSEEYRFETQAPQTIELPDKVQLVSPEDASTLAEDDQPVLTWTSSEEAAEYILHLSADNAFDSLQIDTTLSVSESRSELSDTTYTVESKLASNTDYYWRVKAANEAGKSAWSQTFSFHVEAADTTAVPDTVRLISPEDDSTLSEEDQPVLTWSSSEEAMEYTLNFSPDNAFDSLQIDTTLSVSESRSELSDTTFAVETELAYNTSYYWRVKAANEAGESAWSQTYSFTVEAMDTIEVPDAPELTYPENEASIRVGQNPDLTWTSSEGAAEYILHFAHDDAFDQLMIDTTFSVSESGSEISDTTYTIEDELSGSETYFWRIKAANEAGESSWSEIFSFNVVGGVSIEEEGIPETFALQQNYPNPFNPTTVIPYQLPESAQVTIRIYDMLGREIAVLVEDNKPAGHHTVTFDAQKFSSGMYIYRMDAGEKAFTKKLMLIK